MTEIVGLEGPMNVKRLVRSFRVQAGAGRVTRTRRAILLSALESVVAGGDIEIDGRPSSDESVLRLSHQDWVDVRDSGNRSLEEIPLTEIAEVIDLVEESSSRLSGEALHDYVLRDFYGSERVHDKALQRLRQANIGTSPQRPMHGKKYDGLRRFLADQKGRAVTMDFEDVANLVGGLPPSAYDHQAWWANSRSHSHAAAWLDHRWRAVSVNLNTQSVRFVR